MTRPYCDLELTDMNADVDSKYRLSHLKAFHVPCNHKYAVKKGGKKEQFLMSTTTDGKLNDMTCSVCFKLRTNGVIKTARDEPINTDDVIADVCGEHEGRPLDIHYIKNKDVFYRWLYQHDY